MASGTTDMITMLLAYAEAIGVTRAASIKPELVHVENRLAAFCREPKCPHFGLSMSCPPHVRGPAAMRALLQDCRDVLVLRMEIDGDSLHGEERPSVMRLLHELTAAVEIEARRFGFSRVQGFAGGSCKLSFCSDHINCQVLAGGRCRFPKAARPSMSGYGINVGKLMTAAGWSNSLFPANSQDNEESMSWVAGMVLIG